MRFLPGKLLLAISGLVACLAGLLFPLPISLSGLGPFGSALKDLLHFPTFAALTACLDAILRSVFPSIRRLVSALAAAATALLLALATEWIQGLTGRSQSLLDLAYDTCGIAAALLILLALAAPPSRRAFLVPPALLTVLISSVFLSTPAISAWRAESSQRRLFPDLGGFSSPDALLFWHPQGAPASGAPTSLALTPPDSDPPISGLAVHSAPAPWSGVSKYFPAGTRDWTSFSTLSFSIKNSGAPFVIGIRLDHPNGSISADYPIETGLTPVLLPFTSKRWHPAPPSQSELAEIRKIVLHTGESPVAHPFVLMDIRLLTLPPSGTPTPAQPSTADGRSS